MPCSSQQVCSVAVGFDIGRRFWRAVGAALLVDNGGTNRIQQRLVVGLHPNHLVLQRVEPGEINKLTNKQQKKGDTREVVPIQSIGVRDTVESVQLKSFHPHRWVQAAPRE